MNRLYQTEPENQLVAFVRVKPVLAQISSFVTLVLAYISLFVTLN
jgi:hypothetical protein